MPIRMRAYAGGNEQQRMAQLVQTFPAGNLHVVDLPYRLSSWAFDFPENVGLWEDEREQLLAWAVLQTPFWSLDYALHPGAYEQDVLAEILTWTKTRAQQIRDQPNNGRPMWFVHVPADQGSQMRLLEDAGFYSVEHHAEHPWSGLYLTRTGQAPVPDFSVPDGWTIRPLAGEREVAAYVALHRTVFGSTSMTVDWRARVLQRPEYIPPLDLVVEGPDGGLVAFCVCWIAPLGHENSLAGQVEPLGVHPEYQKMGLGRAVLLEGVRRMQSHGATTMIVETDDFRDAAVGLYQAAGFLVRQKILIYRHNVGDRE